MPSWANLGFEQDGDGSTHLLPGTAVPGD